MNRKRIIQLIMSFLISITLVFADQFSKHLAILHLKDKAAIVLWDKVFKLYYLENRGAAFGILQNQRLFFVFASMVMLSAIVYVFIKMPDTKRYYLVRTFLIMISAGALGNMIDRIRLNYVVDFLYFELINFPIFNVADILVTVGTILMLISILFVYKENDFDYLKFKVKNGES